VGGLCGSCVWVVCCMEVGPACGRGEWGGALAAEMGLVGWMCGIKLQEFQVKGSERDYN